MAENLVINGTTYPGVTTLAMQDENGKTVGFYPDAVRYVEQALTDEQKAQVRKNIGVTGDGERGLSIYRARVESGYMSSLLVDVSALEIPTGYKPQNHDMVLTADKCLYYVDYLDEGAGQVALASYGEVVTLGGDTGLVVVEIVDQENGLANYSASEIKALANQGREVVFRIYVEDGGFNEWSLWSTTGDKVEFRANTEVIRAEHRFTNTHVFVKEDKHVFYDEGGLQVPQSISDLVAGATITTPQMFGAAGDGEQDDTHAIQAALDASSVVYIPDGVYMINATNSGWGKHQTGGIYPRSGQTVLLSKNAILKAMPNDTGFYNIVNINGVSNVRISGGKVQGERNDHAGTTGTFGFGVATYAASNVTIEDMEIFDCWGDSVFIGYTGNVNSSNVSVDNCVIHGSRRQGISITGCERAIIRDCEIYNISGTAPQYGIDIEPDGTGAARDITIDNCYIHDNGVGSIVVAGTDATNELKGVKITNCTLGSFNSVGGSEVYINTCEIGVVSLKATNPVRLSNSIIQKAVLDGGAGFFDACDIKQDSGSDLIVSTLNGYPNKKSKIIFDNCRLSVHGSASVMSIAHGTKGNGNPIDSVVFVNCILEIGKGCLLATSFAENERRFEGCRIVFEGAPDSVFVSTNPMGAGKIVMHNTEVECAETPAYMFYFEGTCVLDVDISGCKLPETSTLFFCSVETVSGSIKMFNNEMGRFSIGGDGTFDKFISNAVDYEMVEGSTNLITSRAVKVGIDAAIAPIKNDILDLKAQGGQQTTLFANSIEECTDTSKVYVLPDGYMYAYKMIYDPGGEPLFTNMLSQAIDMDGVPYNGGLGYKNGVGLETVTAGEEIEDASHGLTGFIPCSKDSILRVKGFTISRNGNYILPYLPDFKRWGSLGQNFSNIDPETGILTVDIASDVGTPEMAYIRITLGSFDDDVIVTINEEIAYTEPSYYYAWTNTGHKFVQTDYEDRILALEAKVAELMGE